MNIELTVEQKMEVAISKVKEARKRIKDEARLALLDNGKYIDYLASIEDEADQVKTLTLLMEQLNKMKPIVTNDGSKYGVNIYPVAEYIFGPVASRVVGIITGSSAMFTEERQLEFEAITGLKYLICAKTRDAIGSPAYYSKGKLANAILCNGEDISNAIIAICISLNIDLDYANKINSTTIDKWFAVAEAKAEKQYKEFKKTEILDVDNNFVLED